MIDCHMIKSYNPDRVCLFDFISRVLRNSAFFVRFKMLTKMYTVLIFSQKEIIVVLIFSQKEIIVTKIYGLWKIMMQMYPLRRGNF